MMELVTIPASHYCEKARWALDACGLKYTESGYAPLLHWAATRRRFGTRLVPVLVETSKEGGETRESVTPDSSAILQRLSQVPEHEWLYPNERARELEAQLSGRLGVHTRKLAYCHVLTSWRLAYKILVGPLTGLQKVLATLLFPLLLQALRRAFQVGPATEQRSFALVREMLDEVSEMLGDEPVGSRFLAGPCMPFSAADIAFCSMVSIVVMPEPEQWTSGRFLNRYWLSPESTSRLESLRATKAGQFVLHCYANYRLVRISQLPEAAPASEPALSTPAHLIVHRCVKTERVAAR
ncbi:hypothetical protein FVE85_4357 [Porphyridium purpureum]|uniref:GST N-terminal domain-containing protein n=1 Tax=Porphyridium purpureum TaxID=35688 RepID=A0A5J4YGT8_PORPP|nr:hypothetical protein FVE85_4357 [Porphyridium purpureum]|eukprot:POR1255..scf270_19